jgi:hypothetical protein
MLACICGGVLEALIFFVFVFVTTGGSIIGTNWWNKRNYQKYLNKHKSCKCECHKDD